VVEPEIVHFMKGRDRIAVYLRERWVLEWIVDRGWPEAVRPLLALAAEVAVLAGRIRGKLVRMAGGTI
jgi:hypothetical protein